MNRIAYGGVLAAALALTACFSSGGDAGSAAGVGDPSPEDPGAVAARAPIDAARPVVTETATFGLG